MGEEKLQPCPICGRTFNTASLERHQIICEKTCTKRRKIFDSSKQRFKGTGIKKVDTKKTIKSAPVQETKKSNWREKHEEFIQAIRAAKTIDTAIKNGEKPPPLPRSHIPSDYIQCPTCERHFSHKAADRHIAWCKEKQARVRNEAPAIEAAERLKARTKYRAPVPGKRNSIPVVSKPEKIKDEIPRSAESAKIGGWSHVSSKSPKSKSSPSGRTRSNDILVNGSTKLAARKESLERKLNGPITNSLKEIRCAKNIFPSTKSCTKLSSPKDKNFIPSINRYSADDNMVLDTSRYGDRSLIRCTRPFGSMGPRTVPGVRVNCNIVRDVTYPLSSSYGHGLSSLISSSHCNNMKSSANHVSDDEEIDEIDISRANNGFNHGRHSPSPVRNHNRHVPAFTTYRRANNGKQGSDSDNRGSTSGSDSSLPPLSVRGGYSGGSSSGELYRLPRFCHDCGTKYPVANAKYCCECGVRRFNIDSLNP